VKQNSNMRPQRHYCGKPGIVRGRTLRRGFILLYVLQLTALLTTLGLAAVMLSRVNVKISAEESDWQHARQLALAGIENGIAEVNSNPDWRTELHNDVVYPSRSGTALGSGFFSWKLIDNDGDLEDRITDGVRIHGIGRVGNTIYTESTLLTPTGSPLSCLESSLHANRHLNLDFGTLSSNQFVSTNKNSVAANGVVVNANVEVVNRIYGSTYNGTRTEGTVTRPVPDSNSIFDHYVNEGTFIDVDSLPALINNRTIERCVLSPALNPFSDNTTNAKGIYVIDCSGQHLRIHQCRIIGTLVILNPGEHSLVDGSVCWEPALPWYPSLLVDGDFEISSNGTALRESDWGVNFNPAGSPYPFLNASGTNSDNDTSDTYRSCLTGLVYISNNLEVLSGSPGFTGVVVTGGSFDLGSASPSFKYRSNFLNFPPPGFTTGDVMAITPGSWRRETTR